MPGLCAVALLMLAACAAPAARDPDPPLAAVAVNGVTLHYVERGAGTPVVFVHGALDDYREWAPVAASLAGSYRTIAYSRRYNFPNDNPLSATDHSARVESRDLEALLRALHAAPAHVVGVSYGAYTALLLAIRDPRLVLSLTLVEPPLLGWLPDLPGGKPLYHQFLDGTWRASGEAFREGDPRRALDVAFDFFVGPGGFERMPPEARAAILSNEREWRALTTSSDPFPSVTRAQVSGLRVPVLMISGARTFPMLKLTDAELGRELRDVRRVVVPGGTHEVCSEQPAECAALIRGFLDGLAR